MRVSGESPRWRRLWLALGAAALIFILYLALIPLADVLPPVSWSDEAAHFLVFCGLMIWFAGLFPARYHWRLLVALLLYGVLMELLQSQVPNRYAELGDLLADTGGLLLGLMLARLGLQRWPVWLERLVYRQ